MWTLAVGLLAGVVGTATAGGIGPKSAMPPAPSYPAPRAVVDAELRSMAPTSLRALDQQYADLAERVSPAVVTIRVQGNREQALTGMSPESGEGSGVIFRPDGYIVTNDHVVAGMEKVTVVLHDGREFDGKVFRANELDIAVVKVEAKDLPSLPFADSTRVRPGQAAMAIGAPFGLEHSVTIGHVSATQRINSIPDPRTGTRRIYWDVIQTDAPINMGNSGGPLINVEGEVIGINSAIQSTTGSGSGVGFAISANQARLLAETLIEKGKVVRGYMGVMPDDLKPFRQKELGLEGGAVLDQVTSDSPGAMAGLKAGDIILQIGDVAVRNQTDLRNSMLRYGPGETVKVVYQRDGQRREASVQLQKSPEQPVAAAPENWRQRLQESPWGRRFGFGPQEEDVEPEGTPMPGAVRLGVQLENPTEQNRAMFGLPRGSEGAVVISVEPDSPAAKAGIQPGDLIVKVGNKTVRNSVDLRQWVAGRKAGESAGIEYLRGSSQRRAAQVRF